jgi:anti-anti-sigma regulatory factor
LLRITEKSDGDDQRVLFLEGKVCCQWLSELRAEIKRAAQERKKLVLDFSRVSFIDEEGTGLINQSLSDSVKTVNCSLFIRKLLGMDTKGFK